MGPGRTRAASRRTAPSHKSFLLLFFKKVALACFLLSSGTAHARTVETLPLPGGLGLPYYTSAHGGARILVVIQGYTRDANRTYDAAAKAGLGDDTLIIAPIFQVARDKDKKCHFHGVPAAKPGDALWKCGTWSDGSPATNGAVTSFQAMDLLLAALHRANPAAGTITVAGFSAGGQYVQRYAAFAHPPDGVAMRYVVSDPSTFLYFDAFRPEPNPGTCGTFDTWKLGTENLPAYLGRDAAAARAVYAHADISYLEGALDDSAGEGTAYKLLDKDCGAQLQGPFRRQRGEFYAAYDARALAHGAHRLTIVPGCAHSVTCVFSKEVTVLGK